MLKRWSVEYVNTDGVEGKIEIVSYIASWAGDSVLSRKDVRRVKAIRFVDYVVN